MGLHVQSKIRRYLGMFQAVSNWPEYLLYKLANSSKPYQFRCRNGLKIEVPKETVSAFKEIFFDQVYTRELPDWWWRIENPVIVDVGANAGYFSLLMAAEKPDATLYAFEPMPANFKIMQGYRAQFPELDFHIFQKAVSGGQEKLVLNFADSDKYTTTAGVVQITPADTKQMQVDAISLTGLVEKLNLDRIDFLKLDCEGSEYDILYSSPQSTLDRIVWMAIESHLSVIAGHDHQSLLKFLQNKGFQIRSAMGSETGYIWATRDFGRRS